MKIASLFYILLKKNLPFIPERLSLYNIRHNLASENFEIKEGILKVSQIWYTVKGQRIIWKY